MACYLHRTICCQNPLCEMGIGFTKLSSLDERGDGVYCQIGCDCDSCVARFHYFGLRLRRGDTQIIIISDGLALTNEFIGGVPPDQIFGARIATFRVAPQIPKSWGGPSC
jgi:hypothetical protein